MLFVKSFFGIALGMGVYLSVLLWSKFESNTLTRLNDFWPVLLIVATVSLCSFIIRYLRWRWLFFRVGVKIGLGNGFLIYLAGFAFALTPGKIGELVRIRYLAKMGVSSQLALAAFLYERIFDLLSVLLLASFFIIPRLHFSFVFFFLFGAIIAIVLLQYMSIFSRKILRFLLYLNLKKFARSYKYLRKGIAGCKIWISPLIMTIFLMFGMLAWGVTALSFVFFSRHLGIWLPFVEQISIYPVSILVGAVSMIPGGLASTESSIVALLSSRGVGLDVSILAAVGIRISTLWFSLFIGVISLIYLETRRSVHPLCK